MAAHTAVMTPGDGNLPEPFAASAAVASFQQHEDRGATLKRQTMMRLLNTRAVDTFKQLFAPENIAQQPTLMIDAADWLADTVRWMLDSSGKPLPFLVQFFFNSIPDETLQTTTWYRVVGDYLIKSLTSKENIDWRIDQLIDYIPQQLLPSIADALVVNTLKKGNGFFDSCNNRLPRFLQKHFENALKMRAGKLDFEQLQQLFPETDAMALTHMANDLWFDKSICNSQVTLNDSTINTIKKLLNNRSKNYLSFSDVDGLTDPQILALFQGKQHFLISADDLINNQRDVELFLSNPALQNVNLVIDFGAATTTPNYLGRILEKAKHLTIQGNYLSSIGNRFLNGCTGLASLDFITPNLTSIGDYFLNGCTGLTRLYFTAPKLRSINSTFLSNTGLTSLDFTGISNVTTIDAYLPQMFKGLADQSVQIPANSPLANALTNHPEKNLFWRYIRLLPAIS